MRHHVESSVASTLPPMSSTSWCGDRNAVQIVVARAHAGAA